VVEIFSSGSGYLSYKYFENKTLVIALSRAHRNPNML